MKKTYLLALCFMLLVPAFAQDKVTVAISSFSGMIDGRRQYSQNSQNTPEVIRSVQDDIEKSFVKAKRFAVVDRSKMDVWYNEKARQQTSDFDYSDRDLVEQGKNFGADYMITGNVVVTTSEHLGQVGANAAQRSVSRNSVVGTAANLSKSVNLPETIEATLKIIKVETGEIVLSETIKGTRGQLDKKIDDFIDKGFPMSVPIVELTGSDLLLVPGADSGVKKGDVFTIYRLVTVEVQGRVMTRQTELGSATVTVLEGDFCTARVQKGVNEIRQAMEQGNTLSAIKK
ncbi:MAG: CsgG/HfaB family protein [Bacteroidetes bacterium]|nr:CsgG/HfaB family protein [Bacteroidota bacterium]